MRKPMTLLRRAVVTAAVITAGGATIGVQAAKAAPPASSLVASPTALSLDVAGVGNPSSAPVSVQLDPSTCLNVFTAGQTYTITANSSDTTGATSVTGDSGPLQCAPARQGVATSATFTVTAVCPATSATIYFAPVSGPPAIQKKLSGTSVAVTVTDTSNSCTVIPPPPTPGGPNPAAPAVTNAYLNANSAVAGTCQSTIGGRNWRGQLLSFIAHWMPRPESVKDTYFTDSNDWILYVETEVNQACGVADGGFLEPNGGGSQSDATFTVPPLSAYAPFSPIH